MKVNPYETCLQCGEAGPAWDPNVIRCQACGFDDAHGFSPVPEIFHHFARTAVSSAPSPTTRSVESLAAEFKRVFKTPEALAQSWEFMR